MKMGTEETLLEASKSAQLTAAFQSISDAEFNGEPKFSPSIMREIAKLVVCRTYSTALLELSHLVYAASQIVPYKGQYEYFFWDSGVAQTSSFKSYCLSHAETCPADILKVDHTGIQIYYSDGRFSIQYSRMPVLSGLMEFLLSALGYSDLDDIFRAPSSAKPSLKSQSQNANRLSKLLYDYLKDHLPTAQSQRKYRALLSFCEQDMEKIDDDLVLSFWQNQEDGNEKSNDFKTFDSVFSGFIRLMQAMDQARDLQAINHASTIGAERDNGEIDPDILHEKLESIDEPFNLLNELDQDPINQIKFLNKQETINLRPIIESGKHGKKLALSLLRNEVFSKTQARITQALRRQAPVEEIKAIIREKNGGGYDQFHELYKTLNRHIERNRLASLYILLRENNLNAISLILDLCPELDAQQLRTMLDVPALPSGSNVVALHPEKMSQNFIHICHNPQQSPAQLSQLIEEAEIAYHGLSRKGFREDPQKNPTLLEAFEEGASLLKPIQDNLVDFCAEFEKEKHDPQFWSQKYKQDHAIFCTQFDRLYGVSS
jgi:hypothetical protein